MTDDQHQNDDQEPIKKRTQELWQVAKKRSGHPFTYETAEELQGDINSYLQWVRENPLYETKAFGTGLVCEIPKKRYPTAAGCALYCGVNPRTWRLWKSPDHHLRGTVLQAEEMMTQIKMEGAASGFFNSTIVARDLGLKEKTEVDANMTVNVIDNFDGEDEDSEE